MSTNKPTKETLSDLKGALCDLEYVLAHFLREGEQGRYSVQLAGDRIKKALAQLTQDDAIPCGAAGCRVVKPTTRAVAAHRNMCRYFQNAKSRRSIS